jgi:hypothetical protein
MVALASVLVIALLSMLITRIATVPRGDALIEPGDLLVLYSTEDRLEELDER